MKTKNIKSQKLSTEQNPQSKPAIYCTSEGKLNDYLTKQQVVIDESKINSNHVRVLEENEFTFTVILQSSYILARKELFALGKMTSMEFQLKNQTFELSFRVFDYFVQKRGQFFRLKAEAKLYYFTCLFIASKYCQIYPPSLFDYIHQLKGSTILQFIRTEIEIIKTINFKLNLSLISHWYGTLFKQPLPEWSYDCYCELGLSYPGRIIAQKIKIIQKRSSYFPIEDLIYEVKILVNPKYIHKKYGIKSYPLSQQIKKCNSENNIKKFHPR